jgi:uncharacterized protein (TIGR02145 family)
MYKQFLILLIVVLMGFYCEESSTGNKADLPEVVTKTVTAITDSSAESGGTVFDDGGAEVEARGVCWCTGQDPTIANDTTNNGAGNGTFTSSLHGLESETDYFIRAYAINKAGTGYGDLLEFTTTEKTTGTVSDIDGNVYKTVKIGDQWWMAENLKVTHYQNGDEIPNVTNKTKWNSLTSGAYCNYDNDATYGRLYNWYAVTDNRKIAPEGWHVPTDDEWKEMDSFIGLNESDADQLGWRGKSEGDKLKSTTGWYADGNGTDEYGFNGLPAGYRDNNANFIDIKHTTGFWTTTEYESSSALVRGLQYDYSEFGRAPNPKHVGLSVRCVKN